MTVPPQIVPLQTCNLNDSLKTEAPPLNQDPNHVVGAWCRMEYNELRSPSIPDCCAVNSYYVQSLYNCLNETTM